MNRRPTWTYQKAVRVAKAEKAVIRAAVGCINPQGHAYTIATESFARMFFINEPAYQRLEHAVAKLKEARKHVPALTSTSVRPK